VFASLCVHSCMCIISANIECESLIIWEQFDKAIEHVLYLRNTCRVTTRIMVTENTDISEYVLNMLCSCYSQSSELQHVSNIFYTELT
jgi:hypothetical protein